MTDTTLANPVDVQERPQWSTQMVLDVAIGTSVDAILDAYNLQFHEYERLKGDVQFMAQVAKMRKELEKEGVTFRLKAQMQAEHYLTTSWDMVKDSEVDPKVRADLIKSTVRWAGFDQPAGTAVGPGGGFTVNINLGNAAPVGTTIEGERE